jgi:hypothetical protein
VRVPRKRLLVLLAAVFFLLMAGLELLAAGLTGMTLYFLGLAGILAATGPALATSPGARRPLRPARFLLQLGVLGVALLSLDRVAIAGHPILAGPALRGVHVSTSATAGTLVASPGHRFLVAEADVASHLGFRMTNVYYGNFWLETDGRKFETALSSQSVPMACDGFEVPAWSSRRCRMVFEVPHDAASARLHFRQLRATAHSGDLDLGGLVQARVPRVELSGSALAGTSLDREHRVRVQVFVRAEALDGAGPVALNRFMLTGTDGDDWTAYDTSKTVMGLSTPCTETVIEDTGTCVAVFDIPAVAEAAFLTLSSPIRPLPGAERSAGVTTLYFGERSGIE